jgi:hypothetical protein
LNLREDPFSALFSRHRIDGFDSPLDDAALQSLLADPDFVRTFRLEIEYQTSLLERYLRQEEIFTGEKIALVDIGWRGHSQSALLRAFRDDPAFRPPEGYYFALWQEFSPNPIADAELKHGLVSDIRRAQTVLEGCSFYMAYLLEAICRAPEGTTLGYREVAGGTIEPVLSEDQRSRDAERSTFAALAPVREGALAYARKYSSDAWRFLASEESARRRIQKKLFRLAFFPSHQELELATRVFQTESTSESFACPLVPAEKISPYRSPVRWLREFRKYPWRSGYLARTGGLPFAVAGFIAESLVLALPEPTRNRLRDLAVLLLKRGGHRRATRS